MISVKEVEPGNFKLLQIHIWLQSKIDSQMDIFTIPQVSVSGGPATSNGRKYGVNWDDFTPKRGRNSTYNWYEPTLLGLTTIYK